MHVTGQPPRVDGTVTAPDVSVEIAASWLLYTLALPPSISYVHLMPPTVSVAASDVSARAIATTAASIVLVFICFIPWSL